MEGKEKKNASTQKKTEKKKKSGIVSEENVQSDKPRKNIPKWFRCVTCAFAYQCNKKFCFKVIF